MSKLYLGVFEWIDDISSRVNIYIVYAAALAVVLFWIFVSMSRSRGLVDNSNAVCVRNIVTFMRTAERDKKQTDELFGILTKSKNDIVMLFHLYCRMYGNFKSIAYYLNYRTYKMINRKHKPWRYSIIVAIAALVSFVFSYSHFVGFRYPFASAEVSAVLLSIACPVGLILLWLMILVTILLKYKMYWVEFENMFRKISELSTDFFATQEAYYDEFAENILKLAPVGGVKRRIERIIARTDTEDLTALLYTSHPGKKGAADGENGGEAAVGPDGQPLPTVPGGAKGQLPMMPGVRILKPHPETEAYLQAHAQITQQLMQMMMQQSMQQTQIVHRALTSQQALASSVVQQNIMAIRLETQQNALQRPNFGKLPADFAYANNPFTAGKDMPMDGTAPQQQSGVPQDIQGVAKIVDDGQVTVEGVDGAKPSQAADAVVEIEGEDKSAAAAAQKTKGNEALMQKLKAAFESLSPPDDDAAKEPDPVFPVPDRELTNVEKRLAQFFTAKVYVYGDDA